MQHYNLMARYRSQILFIFFIVSHTNTTYILKCIQPTSALFWCDESYIQIQIPPTGYLGLIWCSTAEATLVYRWGYFEGMLQLLHARYSCHSSCSIPSKYPRDSSPTCSRSLSSTASFKTYIASQEESGCVLLNWQRVNGSQVITQISLTFSIDCFCTMFMYCNFWGRRVYTHLRTFFAILGATQGAFASDFLLSQGNS